MNQSAAVDNQAVDYVAAGHVAAGHVAAGHVAADDLGQHRLDAADLYGHELVADRLFEGLDSDFPMSDDVAADSLAEHWNGVADLGTTDHHPNRSLHHYEVSTHLNPSLTEESGHL